MIPAQTGVSCSDASDGSATVSVSGGTPPYAYSWSTIPVQTTATATGLASGIYTVTVTDYNRCSASVSVNIPRGEVLAIDPIGNKGLFCPGSIVPDILLSASPVSDAVVYTWQVTGSNIGLANGSTTGNNPRIPSFTTSVVPGVATVTVTATLKSCIDTEVFTITTNDAIPPVITGIPANVSVECGSVPPVATTVTAGDNCDSNPVLTFTEIQTPGNCDGRYTLTRTWTATDDFGNSVSQSQTITVTDTTPPVITLPAASLSLECYDAALVNTWMATASAQDVCQGQVSVTATFNIPTDNCARTVTVTFSAVDACSNLAVLKRLSR